MKHPFQVFLMALLMVGSLSACGHKKAAPAAAAGSNANGVQTGFKDEALAKLSQQAVCQNEIPVDQAPGAGWKEVTLDQLKGSKDVMLQLATIRANGWTVTQDNFVASASVSALVDVDEKGALKNVTETVECKDLRSASGQSLGDQIELAPAAVPAMNALTGQYAQILQLKLVITARDDQKKHELADDQTGRSYFNYWKGVEQARKAWLQKGDDLVVKYYKHTDGHVAIRISKLQHTGEDGNQTVSNTEITYRAVKAADGGQK